MKCQHEVLRWLTARSLRFPGLTDHSVKHALLCSLMDQTMVERRWMFHLHELFAG